MNQAVMNKIDLLLESYFEEASHFGDSELDKRLTSGSTQVKKNRSDLAYDIKLDKSVRDQYKKEGNISLSNMWSNSAIAKSHGSKKHYDNTLRSQKEEMSRQAIYNAVQKNPKVVKMPDKNNPLNNPKTPIKK